jgi:hypothetical protein
MGGSGKGYFSLFNEQTFSSQRMARKGGNCGLTKGVAAGSAPSHRSPGKRAACGKKEEMVHEIKNAWGLRPTVTPTFSPKATPRNPEYRFFLKTNSRRSVSHPQVCLRLSTPHDPSLGFFAAIPPYTSCRLPKHRNTRT